MISLRQPETFARHESSNAISLDSEGPFAEPKHLICYSA